MAAYLDHFYNVGRPLVFAHRGAMAYAPMNTLAAFALAVEQGADGIELDVWLSQDDVPVVIHDFELDHTTDGKGTVGSTPLVALKELDAGGWFDESYAGQRIPTLGEVFEAVGGQTFVNVEIKSVVLDNKNIVWQTLQVIREHGMQERVLVSSFNPLVLRLLHKTAPDIATGYLYLGRSPWYLRWALRGITYHAEHPQASAMDAETVQKARRHNRRVNVWTVNEEDEAKRLQDLGVDGLITDRPDAILQALGAL